MEIVFYTVISYLFVAALVGSYHVGIYGNPSRVPYVSPLTSYGLVGLFWPLSVPLMITVFILRAFDVDI